MKIHPVSFVMYHINLSSKESIVVKYEKVIDIKFNN